MKTVLIIIFTATHCQFGTRFIGFIVYSVFACEFVDLLKFIKFIVMLKFIKYSTVKHSIMGV